jgi:hypothetical protein
MTFGTEHLVILESYAKQQTQVYSDSCDFGVIAGPEVKAQIRAACKGLAKIYVSEKKISGSYPNGGLAQWSTFIPVERDDYQPNAMVGTKVEVTLVETNTPRYPAYFTIELKNESQPADKEFFKEVA